LDIVLWWELTDRPLSSTDPARASPRRRRFDVIADGKQVQLHYTLRVDGEVVDTSREGDPLTYVHGQGTLIAGLETALAGLSEGEKKEVSLPPEQAYGMRNPDATQDVPKQAFGNIENLNVGDRVGGEAGGRPFQATVVEIADETVTIDMNHPLAGKTLNFDVEVVHVA
jgi:FKBP-type peptidyl-prolyl cis-trans isomerase SlyD